MTDFQPTNAQGEVITILMDLIGFSGVHRRPEQNGDVILDLLPAEHVAFASGPFCVRIKPDGVMQQISDKDAGLDERPSPMEAMRLEADRILTTLKKEGP